MNPGRPSEVRALLAQLDIRPNTGLGQNFLIDNNIRELILREANLNPDDRVLEVGPGLGMLTEGLLASGADVVAVEKDRALAAYLRERFIGAPDLVLVEADALREDLPALFGDSPATHVISNLPYSVGTRILVSLMRGAQPPRCMVVTLQKEVAERIAASPGTPAYGLLAVWAQLRYATAILHTVSPTCFWPVPDVSSAIIRLDLLDRPAMSDAHVRCFYDVTKRVFSQRRKKLSTSLRKQYPAAFSTIGDADALLGEAGISPDARPQNVGVAQWEALTGKLAGVLAAGSDGTSP